MPWKSRLYALLLALLVLLTGVASRAGGPPRGPVRLAVISTTDCWSEIAPCG
ncbi:MAG TPA: hypothetical protein VMS93_10990 [Candidatus Saccharimonadales bacterium]|nr:hypothetical protein [Candidatus Saccharimonadales bacterium]